MTDTSSQVPVSNGRRIREAFLGNVEISYPQSFHMYVDCSFGVVQRLCIKNGNIEYKNNSLIYGFVGKTHMDLFMDCG